MTGAPGNWMVHTPAKAGCPGLVLHVMRDGNDLKGFAATGDMAAMSRLTGAIDAKQQFTITMTPVDGKGPVGTITGSRNQSDGWLLAQVKVAGCDGPLKILTYVLPGLVSQAPLQFAIGCRAIGAPTDADAGQAAPLTRGEKNTMPPQRSQEWRTRMNDSSRSIEHRCARHRPIAGGTAADCTERTGAKRPNIVMLTDDTGWNVWRFIQWRRWPGPSTRTSIRSPQRAPSSPTGTAKQAARPAGPPS
jgi:hypothetical protein